MAEIKADKIEIGKLFSDPLQFRIPNFQRPLSWEKDNFDKLFEDIYEAFRTKQGEYFLGSVILQGQKDIYDTIDGQQRLTALAVLLAVIRDNTNNKDLEESIHRSLYTKEDKFKHLPSVPRIRMWEDLAQLEEFVFATGKTGEYLKKVEEDRSFYKDKSDPKYCLYQAIVLYIQKHEEKLQNDDQAGKFVEYLFNHVYVVRISTESLPYAIQLFNVLNTRGLPLTTADILKAVNLGEIEEEKRDKWAKRWREIENTIGREEIEKVIKYIRTLKLKAKARVSIYEEYEKLIFNEKLGKGEKFIEYLEKISDTHRKLVLEPKDLRVENKYINLVKLMRDYIPFDDWIPPLIAFYEFCTLTDCTHNLLPDFLVNLEKKTVVEWVTRLSPTKRIESLNNVIKIIEGEGEPKRVVESINNSDIKEKMENFKTQIDDRDFYHEHFAKYLLLRLDLEMWDQENFSGYEGIITIEHVLPQDPSKDSEWFKNFTEEERNGWTNKIGNLILLGRRKNSRARNYEFEKKKKEYFFKDGGTPFQITQELKNINTWTFDELKTRQEKLVEKLIEIYFGA